MVLVVGLPLLLKVRVLLEHVQEIWVIRITLIKSVVPKVLHIALNVGEFNIAFPEGKDVLY